MKKPFHHTQDYMIVRESTRIQNKKRSLSNSSASSFDSTRFAVNSGYQAGWPSYDRVHCEYGVGGGRASVYQVERKRVEIFGVEELRYKPAYFDSISKSKEKQQPKPQTTQKVLRTTALKTQKSIKQIKFTDKSIPKATQKIIEIVQQPKIEKRVSSSTQALKKRGSILEQMIEINVQNNGKSNQFYASAMDLKSKVDIYREHPYPHPNTKRTRKSSVFYDECERLPDLPQLKSSKTYSEAESNAKSKFSQVTLQQNESRQSQEPESEPVIDPPPTISVRGRVFYRYQKGVKNY